LIEAVGNKQPTRYLREMWGIKNARLSPTMQVCRFVGSFTLKWKATKNLLGREVPDDLIIGKLGVSPWYYQNKLRKIAAIWSQEELAELASICSDTEQAVFSGQIDPWIFFCSRTYNLLSSSRG